MRGHPSRNTSVLMAIAMLALSGCISDRIDEPHVVERPGVDIVSMPEDFRSVFLSTSGGESFCLAPPADAMVATSESLGSSGGTLSDLSLSDRTDLQALGGRSSTLLIAREVLYRTCEFTKNHLTTTDSKIAAFERALDIVRAVAVDNQASLSDQ